MKILCVLDSHVGELHNLVPMIFHWGKSGELLHSHIDFVYVGYMLNASEILKELSILQPYVTFDLKLLPILSPRNFGLHKVLNFLQLAIRYVLFKRYRLTFIPYDQRPLFNRLFMFRKGQIFAVPHTTGDEVYSEGVFKNRALRKKKGFPVLAKSSASQEYFSALGFDHCIVTGRYFQSQDYLDTIIFPENTQEEGIKLCIFTLARHTQLFSEDSWIKVHRDILLTVAEAGLSNVYIKIHPSQPSGDLDDLLIYAKKLSVNVVLVSTNPSIVAARFDIFITVLTSAGQHAKAVGKPVCCYASPEMREEVRKFGNDPYPYSKLDVPEIVSRKELAQWLKNSEKLGDTVESFNEIRLLSLEDLCRTRR